MNTDNVNYIITEHSNGIECDVAVFLSWEIALRFFDAYSDDDKDALRPCIYKILPDNTRTTEY